MKQLLDRVAADRLDVTRNGTAYLGLRGRDGKRFRVHFSFPNESHRRSSTSLTPPQLAPREVRVVLPKAGYWIYALLAHSPDGERKACYIGQTVNLKRRFREHLRRDRPGRASSALFEWAASEEAPVRAAVLLRVESEQSYASRCEGYWLRLATDAGFIAPNVNQWGRLPQLCDPAGQPSYWPASEILAISLPLSDLVEHGLEPVELFVVSRAQSDQG